MTEKTCSICEVTKPLGQFPPNKEGAGGVQGRCRPCHKTYAREWARSRKAKSRRLQYLYGITLEDYEAMSEAQNGLCAICEQEPVGEGPTNEALHVDHNHDTGEVRGLLCTHCNHGLGKFKDDTVLLLRAADYLMEHSPSEEPAAVD